MKSLGRVKLFDVLYEQHTVRVYERHIERNMWVLGVCALIAIAAYYIVLRLYPDDFSFHMQVAVELALPFPLFFILTIERMRWKASVLEAEFVLQSSNDLVRHAAETRFSPMQHIADLQADSGIVEENTQVQTTAEAGSEPRQLAKNDEAVRPRQEVLEVRIKEERDGE